MTTWLILRAAGVGSFLMLFGAVAWGLVSTTGAVSQRLHRSATILIHQVLGTAGLVLLVIHVAGLMLDEFVRFDIVDVLVPMSSEFRPVAVTLGVVSMYCMVLVLVSSWARKRLSTPMWRRIHVLSVPACAMGLTHGMLSGTDTQAPWMWWTYVGSAVLIVFLMVMRAATAGMAKQTAAARKAGTPAAGPAPVATPAPPVASPAPATVVDPSERVAAARAKAAAMRAAKAAASGHHAPATPKVEPDEVPQPAEAPAPAAVPAPPTSQDDRVAAARARAAVMRAARAAAAQG